MKTGTFNIKIILKSLLLAASVLIMSSCSSDSSLSQNTPALKNTPLFNTQTPPTKNIKNMGTNLISLFDDLYYQQKSLNAIRKKGDTKDLKASGSLKNIVKDMLQKSERTDINSIEGSRWLPGYDYNKYDYIMKFDAAKDILLSLSDNTFHLEGEKQVYKLWGDSRLFWQSLETNYTGGGIDLGKKTDICMAQYYKQDLDGDGTSEDIELLITTNGSLVMKINGRETNINSSMNWSTTPFHSVNESPSIKFLNKGFGKGLLPVVSFSWATNKVGSTGIVYAYDYFGGKLKELPVEIPQMEFSYLDGKEVKVSFARPKTTQTAKISSNGSQNITGINDSGFKDMLKSRDNFWPHTLSYSSRDFNADGMTELASVSLLRFQAPFFSLGSLYTIYKYDSGSIIPVKTVITPPYNENDKPSIVRNEIMDAIFQNGCLDLTRTDTNDPLKRLERSYGQELLDQAMNSLIKEGHLVSRKNIINLKF